MKAYRFVFSIIFGLLIGMAIAFVTKAEGGLAIIGDGELIDAVAFSNGDTLAVLSTDSRIEFVYTYIGGGSSRDRFKVGLTPLSYAKLVVSGRWAHLVASGNGQTYQFSFKLPDDAPYFNCPTQLLPGIGS